MTGQSLTIMGLIVLAIALAVEIRSRRHWQRREKLAWACLASQQRLTATYRRVFLHLSDMSDQIHHAAACDVHLGGQCTCDRDDMVTALKEAAGIVKAAEQ